MVDIFEKVLFAVMRENTKARIELDEYVVNAWCKYLILICEFIKYTYMWIIMDKENWKINKEDQ